MPLLNKKPFVLEEVPDDLRADEEVFVCQATKEVFRDYEKFFNRHFLCNSPVWACELTGQTNLTYTQALESEKGAMKLLESLPVCFQKASLSLIHHTRRTNLRTLADEICSFYRSRYIAGEVLELKQTTSSGAQLMSPVRVLKVIPPSGPASPLKSPFRIPVITAVSPSSRSASRSPTSQKHSPSQASDSQLSSPPPPHPPTVTGPDSSSSSHKEAETTTCPTSPLKMATPNGLPSSEASVQDADSDFKLPKTPRTPLTPLSTEITLDPADYKYIVEFVDKPDTIKVQVKGTQLGRQKGIFTPRKLKVYLRSALFRPSEKHPFFVKEEYVQKFNLGPTSVDLSAIIQTPSPRTAGRKRSYSQANLDSFFDSGATPSSAKTPRPTSLNTSAGGKVGKKTQRKTPKGSSRKSSKSGKKGKKHRSPSKTPKTPKSSLIFPGTPKSFKTPTPKSPKSPRKLEALKALNKAKKYKQMDLKKNVMQNGPLSKDEMTELKLRGELERLRRAEAREIDKLRKKEERLQKLRDTLELRRKEKLKEKEWLKPREDLLCEDNKPLPEATLVVSSLPLEVFGDTVMVMEFLNTFGPLFNIKEVIRGGITFDKMEYALGTQETDSMLFEMVKFLLQAIFATMEEEKEGIINMAATLRASNKSEHPTTTTTTTTATTTTDTADENQNPDESPKNDNEESDSKFETDAEKQKNGGGLKESARDEEAPLIDDIMEEGAEKEEEKPLDVQIQAVKASALTLAKWSQITQRVPLQELTLDPYTCTEVLRLHLLASGGYVDSGERNTFRHYRRGGYTDADNPAIELRLRRPGLFDLLATTSIYSLSTSDKIELLSTLCSQLLSYSATREYLDEAAGRLKKARKKIREMQFTEEKRKREEKAAVFKEKKEKARLKKQEQEKKQPEPSTTDTTKADSKVNLPLNSESSSARPQQNGSRDKTSSSPPQVSKTSNEEAITRSKDETTEEERKERMDEELLALNEELSEASTALNLRPLGSDRNHQKYWVFPSLPGVFVEHPVQLPDGQNDTTQSTLVAAKPAVSFSAMPSKAQINILPSLMDTSDGSSLPTLVSSALPVPNTQYNALASSPMVSTAQNIAHTTHSDIALKSSDTTITSQPLTKSLPKIWSCFTSFDKVNDLLDSLNPRGIREVELKKALELQQRHLEATLHKCPFGEASQSPTAAAKTSNADHYLELYLREQILDIEEKIYIGTLGYLRDVENRSNWRMAIENSGAAASVEKEEAKDENSDGNDSESTQDKADHISTSKDGDHISKDGDHIISKDGDHIISKDENHSRLASPYLLLQEEGSAKPAKSGNVTPCVNPAVRELSTSLLQVQAGIEKKYLMPPLGMAIDRKKIKSKKNGVIKESDICLENWRRSLAKVTSFSQIFVHLATLERAVMWSRSLMNMRCCICRRKGGDEFMLLCDGCDHGYHMYCLRPPLQSVPEGDWFCYDCSPVTPVKARRRVQRVLIAVEESSDESECEQERELEESDDQDSTEEEEEEEEESEESEEEEDMDAAPARSLRSRTQASSKSVSGGKAKTSRSSHNTRQTSAKSQSKKTTKWKKKKIVLGKRQSTTKQSAKTAKRRTSKTSQEKSPPPLSEHSKAQKRLKLDTAPSPPLPQPSKAEGVIASIIDLRCSHGSKQHTNAAKRELKSLETHLCEALWEEVNDREESWNFATPVKKKEYPDYFDMIAEPLDLRTVRSRIKLGKYDRLDDFLTDMQLIFSNCLKYHKRHSDIGKAGASLKRFFEKRCSDLGLKDLSLCQSEAGSSGAGGGGLRSGRRGARK